MCKERKLSYRARYSSLKKYIDLSKTRHQLTYIVISTHTFAYYMGIGVPEAMSQPHCAISKALTLGKVAKNLLYKVIKV